MPFPGTSPVMRRHARSWWCRWSIGTAIWWACSIWTARSRAASTRRIRRAWSGLPRRTSRRCDNDVTGSVTTDAWGAVLRNAPMRTLLLIGLLLFSTSAFASGQAGGVSWTTPDAFVRQPDRQMRAATYALPKAKGDADAPELAVFYFGPGQGGGVQANIRRWSEQLSGKDGKPIQAKTSVKEVNGLKVHLVEGKGTYRSGGFGAPVVQKPGYQLLGAIVEGPEGAIFFKL